MALRFPFVKRRDPALDDGDINAPRVDLQQAAMNQSPDRMSGVPSTYPTIDPNYVPPVEPSSTVATETSSVTPPPAIDPAILAKIRPATPAPVRVPVSAEPPPIFVRHPGERPGKPTRPVREGMSEGTPEDQNAAYGKAVDQYVPKAEPKWKRYLRIATGVGSMFAGAAARDPYAVARAAEATGANLADSRFIDKAWKQQQQAEVAKQQDRYLGQRKAEATIKEIEARPEEKAARERRLQKGVDLRGQRVSDQKINDGLARYNQLKNFDPESAKDAGLKRIFEENYGLYDLPPKSDDKFAIKMVNGEYEWVPTKPGEVTTVTKNGEALVDRSHVPDQSVKLPNGTVMEYLTPVEAAAWEGKVYESEADRKSREKIASESQAGQNTRAAMRGSGKGSAINPSVRGAVSSLSKFRQMTANIEEQKALLGTSEGPASDDNPAIRSLYEQRDGFESDMKKMYGDYIEFDSNGKPKGLRDDAVRPASPAATYTEQDVRDRWNATPRNKRIHKTADAAVAAARAANLIP